VGLDDQVNTAERIDLGARIALAYVLESNHARKCNPDGVTKRRND